MENAQTARDIACELIYRLYKNIINKRYQVECEELDIRYLGELYYIYSSGCDIPESITCLKLHLDNKDFGCAKELSSSLLVCTIATNVVEFPTCTTPTLIAIEGDILTPVDSSNTEIFQPPVINQIDDFEELPNDEVI